MNVHSSGVAVRHAARLDGPANKSVCAVAYDGLCTFEFGCAVEVFGLPRPEFGDDWYQFSIYGAGKGPYRATGGFTVEANSDIRALVDAGTVVFPGWRHPDEAAPAELLEALRIAHRRGARILSICAGTFVLAQAGLLSGLKATTHWRYTDLLRSKFPEVLVEDDVLYIDNGQVLTSAGSAAGLDLCLHLVRRDYGARIANLVAKRLVIPPHRDGGQAQFIERPLPDRAGSHFSKLFDHVRRDLAADLSIARMADLAAMSQRTFLRRFREATGTTPMEWLVAERTSRAKELLEATSLTIDQVAAVAGFGNASALRHHFQKRVGVSPGRYRATFSETGHD